MSCSWGDTLRIRVFGASHAAAVGVTIDGLPAGEAVDLPALERFLQRRAPGNSALSSARREADRPQILSGLEDGRTTGGALTILIENTDVRSADYDSLRDVPRPGHADYPAMIKAGSDALPGGGQFSGRMTAPLCAAGGVCLQILRRRGVEIAAHIGEIGGIRDAAFDPLEPAAALPPTAELPVLDEAAGEAMRAAILAAAAQGDSLGGTVECVVTGLPVGLGGALFDGLDGKFAAALFGVPAVKGVEFGEGFAAARLRGSENNDAYAVRDGAVVTETNHAGGVLGGMSTGMPLVFRAAFKPTPSIAGPQKSVRLSTLEETELRIGGRHDPCVVPRAVPVVEAVAALAVLDALLTEKTAAEGPHDLRALRAAIDRTDDALVPRLSERMRLSDEIGRLKQEKRLPVRDTAREEEVLRRARALAEEDCAESVEQVYRAVLSASRARQEGEEPT